MAEHDRRATEPAQEAPPPAPPPPPAAAPLPEPTQRADAPRAGGPLVGGAVGYVSTYLDMPRDIWASSVGRRVRSYTFDASSYAADANGDKIIREGTVLRGQAGKAVVHLAGTTATFVLTHRINVRDGDVEIAVADAGSIRSDRCWDNNVYGTVLAQTKLDLPAINFVTFDY